MQKINLNRIQIYRFDIFSGYSDITHFISTKNPSMKKDFNICLWAVDEVLSVIENRKILASELNIRMSSFVFQQQMHTQNVTVIGTNDISRGVIDYDTALNDNDGMITNEKGACMIVIGGDCVPILFFDPKKKVVGVAHSGWRGTAKRIAENTVKNMKEHYDSNPADILIGIGPSISQEYYEVDDTVVKAFANSYKSYSVLFKPSVNKGKYLLDLWKANEMQLIEAGVLPKNIEVARICTYKNNNEFFSARHGDSGRFGCGIMLV